MEERKQHIFSNADITKLILRNKKKNSSRCYISDNDRILLKEISEYLNNYRKSSVVEDTTSLSCCISLLHQTIFENGGYTSLKCECTDKMKCTCN